MISPLLSRPLGQAVCQKKRKPSRNLNFWVWVAVFQPKLNKLRKTTQKWCFSYVFRSILDVFEDYSILTEKQWLKPKNSSSLKFSASFDTHLDPRGAILVERNDLMGKCPCVKCQAQVLHVELYMNQ